MDYVEQEKAVSTKHPKLGDVEFKVKVPQATSLAELTTLCGGEDGLRDFANAAISTNAKNAARAYARNYEVADGTDPNTFPALISALVTKAQDKAQNYDPSTDAAAGPSKAKKAAAFDELSALVQSGKEFTKEDLFALLSKAK
jgi:hypothetical protein